ncbi:MAG: rhomboid family intramembrane serine protease [Syntrophothermus sp.]
MAITYAIIGITTLVSIYCFNEPRFFDKLKFNAFDVKHSNQWHRFFTYGFVHAGWIHLLINMFVLYSFGAGLEDYFAQVKPDQSFLMYFTLYLGSLIVSTVPSYYKHKNDVFYNSVGASGAVSAVLFAYILAMPWQKLMIFPIPFPLPAPLFAVLFLVYESYMSKRGKDNVGHDAHISGAVFGLVFMLIIQPELAKQFLDFLKGAL